MSAGAIIDPSNQLTISTLLLPGASNSNNAATSDFDLKDYVGRVAVRVSIGTKTAGDNDGAITVKLQHSDDNTAANATDLDVGNVATTNNATKSGTLIVDTRATKRFLFARRIIAGTNSPSYPVAIEVIGQKQVQP